MFAGLRLGGGVDRSEFARFDLVGLDSTDIRPRQEIDLRVTKPDGSSYSVAVVRRIDTPFEIEYYKNGGILPFVLRELLSAN